ncbi:MAG: hypothetical protein HOW73_22275 [Polyangiaceae bacterium]|nr:hypothetical protein [Polyangiaceae bacterium]
MARLSRPPGFDMTYKPTKATFLMPWRVRLPATIYFAIACVVGSAVILAPHIPGSWLYRAVVEGDRYRVMTAPVFAILVFTSALAAIVRQQLTGVIVRPDGIETREVAFGMPRIKRLAWAQIDRVAIPFQAPSTAGAPLTAFKKIRLDLWNGHHEFLPDVAQFSELSVIIERVALARAIPIEGGTGLVDELGNPFGEEDED